MEVTGWGRGRGGWVDSSERRGEGGFLERFLGFGVRVRICLCRFRLVFSFDWVASSHADYHYLRMQTHKF